MGVEKLFLNLALFWFSERRTWHVDVQRPIAIYQPSDSGDLKTNVLIFDRYFFQVRETLKANVLCICNYNRQDLCLKHYTLFLIMYNVTEHGYSGIPEKSFAEQRNAK